MLNDRENILRVLREKPLKAYEVMKHGRKVLSETTCYMTDDRRTHLSPVLRHLGRRDFLARDHVQLFRKLELEEVVLRRWHRFAN